MPNEIKCILFDCMETLIDVTELPTLRDYAFWTFNGSEVEYYWRDFEEFFLQYQEAKKVLAERLPEFKEYELMKRLKYAVGLKTGECNIDKDKDTLKDKVANKLYQNYWRVYVSKTYVRDDVKPALMRLSQEYRLGVVSNFIVKGGIEELLEIHGISPFFDFVITSVNVGWRKPNPEIFKAAIKEAGSLPEEIVFIGDNYEQDFEGSRKMGLKAILLDRRNTNPFIKERVVDFYELNTTQ